MKISKFMTPEIILGSGSISQVGEAALRLGAMNAFVVSDSGVEKAGWVDEVASSLQQCGLSYTSWTKVSSNPKDYEVEEGSQKYLQSECDAIIAVGGGSPIDCAKAIAILVSNGGSIHQYEGVHKVARPLPPMVVVPTTAGSGSEVSQFSIIVDTCRRLKMTIISRSLIPDIAIIDPTALSTKDAKLTANTGIDALTHAIEAYVSIAATPLTDVHALNAIKLISSNLRESVSSKTNLAAKEAMATASLQAGMAFSNAILGLVHAMSHQLGGLYDVPHGEANAVLLPYVMEYNLVSNPSRFADIARALGESLDGLSIRQQAEKAIGAVSTLCSDIGIASSLKDLGAEEDWLPLLAHHTLADVCIVTNPRDVSEEDAKRLFYNAFWGRGPR